MTDTGKQTPSATKTPPPIGETKTAVVKLSDLTLAAKWNREKVGDIRGLAQSIKERGLQVALTVRPDPKKKGKFVITDGRRRYAALQEIGAATAAVVIKDTDAGGAFLDSLLINLQREDNTDYELALGFGECSEHGMSGKDIAHACGKTEGFVSHRLAVLKLPKKWQNEVKREKISVTHARMAASLFSSEDKKDATFAEKLLTKFLEGGLNTTQGQERLDKYLEKKAATAKAKGQKVTGKAKKGAKGTSKGAGKKDTKPEVKTAYTKEVQKEMQMITPAKATEWLVHYEERLSRTSSEKNRARLKGMIEMGEIFCGLRVEE